MADYSGKKHIVAALRRRFTDRVPVTILIGPYCSRLTNYSIKEILQDAKKSTEAHLAFYNRFEPDSVIIYNDIYLEVEALGCELEFPENDISHPKTVLHICGEIDPILEDVIDTGINFLSLDAPSSLQRLIETGNGKVTVMGNIPTTFFSTGTRLEMEKAIRDCIENAAEGSGYILASGCEIPMDSTEDRIDHFFNYSRQYGRQFMSTLKERRPELFQ